MCRRPRHPRSRRLLTGGTPPFQALATRIHFLRNVVAVLPKDCADIEGKEDLSALADFPDRHWKKIRPTKPPERINREIKRRTGVVQIFPNLDALKRLTTVVLVEMHDEWITFPSCYLPEGSVDMIYPERKIGSTSLHDHRGTGPQSKSR